MVEFINIGKVYKTFELNQINFTANKGEIIGIVGENGAGKTTILKILLGIIRKFYGKLVVFGNPEFDYAKNEHIGIVFDDNPFIENMTAEKISESFNGIYKTWDKYKFFHLIDSFNIVRNKKVKEYSKGMTVKLQIAVALAHGTKLLILDEPTNGLDPVSKDILWDLIYEFMEDGEKSIIITSHIISDIEKICDKILFIHDGEVVFFEEKETLIEQYAMLKCTNDEFEILNQNKIIGFRKNEYSVECLVKKIDFSDEYLLDRVSLEDILVYTLRGEL